MSENLFNGIGEIFAKISEERSKPTTTEKVIIEYFKEFEQIVYEWLDDDFDNRLHLITDWEEQKDNLEDIIKEYVENNINKQYKDYFIAKEKEIISEIDNLCFAKYNESLMKQTQELFILYYIPMIRHYLKTKHKRFKSTEQDENLEYMFYRLQIALRKLFTTKPKLKSIKQQLITQFKGSVE